MSRRTTAERLRRAGLRVTHQRLLVADALVAAGRQVTAQELYERLRRHDDGIGRATAFRALESLVAAGVARRMELEGHVYGYVACRADHHHHLACQQCGRVEEIDESYVASLTRRIESGLGFHVDDARLDFYGVCATCSESGVEAGNASERR